MEVQSRQITVTILETSDVHGSILPLNYANNRHSPVGLAKISTLVNEERLKNPNIILIDNGDFLQGTPLTYYHCRIDSKPQNPMIKVMNHIGYDGLVLGNHEFNYGLDILHKAKKESTFPWLSGNIVSSSSQPSFGKPYIIKTYENGLRIGVLGITTHYIPNWEYPGNIEGLEFIDAVQSTKEWVKVLREQECVDFLIVSYHGGFEKSPDTGLPTEGDTGENQGYRICTEIKGIDLLLTGHQHRVLEDNVINGVTIIQPGSQGQYLGKAEVSFEYRYGKWNVVSKKAELLPVKDAAADNNIISMVEEYEKATQIWLDQPIGKIYGDMVVKDPLLIRVKDNELIEFINNVQMKYAGVDISNTALFDNSAPGFERDVTMRDIVSNYIYPNTLRVIRLKGQDIKDALEKSATYFEAYDGKEIRVNAEFITPKPQHYNYDMWEGIEYKINISRPFGQRIVGLNYKGSPLDMEGEYDVVMNNYRAGGGGDYLMFKDKQVVRDIPTDVSELIANYILEQGTINATLNHNWEVIHD